MEKKRCLADLSEGTFADVNHLAANIFVGNYYYLMAEQEKQQLMRDYKKISSPTGCSMPVIKTD